MRIFSAILCYIAFCHASDSYMNAVALLHHGESLQQQQIVSQQAGLAYMEPMPMALIGGSNPRGPRALSAAVHHIPLSTANPRVSFCPMALEQTSRGQSGLSRGRTPLLFDRTKTVGDHLTALSASQMDSEEVQAVEAEVFDPLGLASGMSNSDMDTAILQKQLWVSSKAGDLPGVMSAISKGADLNYKYAEEGDATVVHCAALHGHTEIVTKLSSLGANINSCDKYKWTALHDAALNGHTETVAKLVSLGALINAKTDIEDETPGAGLRTPLTCAAMNGHTETVKKLVSLGAELNARQKDGWTALHLAAKNGWHETVEALVGLGMDVNVKNEVDMTPLHYAAWDATLETCQKLIDLGVDVKHKAKGKLSALDLAERRKKETGGNVVAELLREMEGSRQAAGAAGAGEESDVWESPPDDEWRALIQNNPYARSSDGLDF